MRARGGNVTDVTEIPFSFDSKAVVKEDILETTMLVPFN